MSCMSSFHHRPLPPSTPLQTSSLPLPPSPIPCFAEPCQGMTNVHSPTTAQYRRTAWIGPATFPTSLHLNQPRIQVKQIDLVWSLLILAVAMGDYWVGQVWISSTTPRERQNPCPLPRASEFLCKASRSPSQLACRTSKVEPKTLIIE